MTTTQPLTVALPDGRALTYAEWGDPDGFPVIAHHGTPGCRLNRHPNQDLRRGTGARIILFDRAGYGGSDRNRGRRVVDVVPDVEALADALGIDRFAVTGGSGGGPHSLATAALLPDRVTRALCVVGAAPYDALGHDAWFDGMDPENIKELGYALADEDILSAELTRMDGEMRARVAADPANVLGDIDLPDADRAVLARPDFAQVIREVTEEQTRNGVGGWADDDLAFTRPWGFDVASIRVPVAVWWGAADVLVPAAHGEWLAANVPGAVARVAETGHIGNPDEDLKRQYAWLLDGATDWD